MKADMNNQILKAAQAALDWLDTVSDSDLLAALIECDDALARAFIPSYADLPKVE